MGVNMYTYMYAGCLAHGKHPKCGSCYCYVLLNRQSHPKSEHPCADADTATYGGVELANLEGAKSRLDPNQPPEPFHLLSKLYRLHFASLGSFL